MRRKTSGLDGVPPSNRLRLTILLGVLAALMLVPAANAFAFFGGNAKVNIVGSGSGTVISYSEGVGSPAINCTYNGSAQSGTCANEPYYEEEEAEYFRIYLEAIPAEGSELGTGQVDGAWTITKGEPFVGECGTSEFVHPNPPVCWITSSSEKENLEVTAEFKASAPAGPKLTLNVEEGSGTVVSNPAGLECTGSSPKTCETQAIPAGSVTLTASPAAGYLFKSWKGCGSVNGRQCTVSLTEAKTVGAKFYKAWSLEGKKSNPNGIFSTAPGGVNCGYGCNSSTALYKEGALTLKAKPAKNFHFVKFTNGTGSAASCNEVTTETCSIGTFSSNSSIEEVYVENTKHTLTFSKEGGGQGFVKTKPTNVNCGYTCSAAKAEFFSSEEVPVTVTLNKGTTQVTWTTSAGTCTAHALSCSVPMSADRTLVAKFE